MNESQFRVVYKGKYQYSLNSGLARRQGVTSKELATLIALHRYKLSIFDEMRATDDPTTLKELATIVEQIEFAMQETWHFTPNVDMHEWYNVPKCTCPKLDNQDYRGTSYRVYNGTCPIHGILVGTS